MSLTRVAVVKTSLGDGLQLRSMVGHEELGRAFRYELELVSTDANIDFDLVLGTTMTVELETPTDVREFTGYVTEFVLAGGTGRNVLYRAVLVPWLGLLSYKTNCRIFQQMTVPDVAKQVFRDAGYSDFEDRLSEPHRVWDYLVQYRESDFAFVSRIFEQEGIYHYVKHSAGRHMLILCDSRSGHEAVAGNPVIPYFPPERQQRDRDHIDSWAVAARIKPGAVAATDFDFTRPRASLLTRRTEPEEIAGESYEDYDYPGEFLTEGEATKELNVRIEAHHAERQVAEGTGDALGISAGMTFTLDQFPRASENKEYLIVRATYQIQVNADESGIDAGPAYRCQFAAIDSVRPFRAARITPKPIVQGPQTAIVVGPAGDEIYTDEYGRVKVKFHWDRSPARNENSSCWVRVAQIWAGTNFGGIHIPRIGQEVIVDFLEGDPDRPIITGRVYNNDNQVPYELPGNMTQSGIKSHSTLGGALNNYNELRFEDKIGSEQVYLQAEKDLATLVKNEEQRDVIKSRTTNIGTDETLDVGGNRSATIAFEDGEKVGANQTVDVGANQTITVVATRTVTSAIENITTGTRKKTVTANEDTDIGGTRTETVTGKEDITIGGAQVVTVNGTRKHSVDKDDSLEVVGARVQNIRQNDRLEVGKNLLVTAADEIVLRTGDASVTLRKNGDIIIKGKNIQIDGSGKINIKATGDVVVKGQKIANN